MKPMMFFLLLSQLLLPGYEKPATDGIIIKRIQQHVDALVGLGSRAAGSQGEKQAAEYVVEQLAQVGIKAQTELFSLECFETTQVTIIVGGEQLIPERLGFDPYGGELQTGHLTHTGSFVAVDPESQTPWPDVSGKVVMTAQTTDGGAFFRLAAQQPRLIVFLKSEDLKRVLGKKEKACQITIAGELKTIHSRNVVAHWGAQAPAVQILVGAHLDSYRQAPGANDNATGLAAVLEMARYFQGRSVPKNVGLSFIAFGSEELGVAGSRRYVEAHAEELASCSLVLVLDNLGGKGSVLIEKDEGSEESPTNVGITRLPDAYKSRAWEGASTFWRLVPPLQLFQAFNAYHPIWLKKAIDRSTKLLPFPVVFTGLQGSDQMAFAAAGLASTGVSAPNGVEHTSDDTTESVNFTKVFQCFDAARVILDGVISGRDPMLKNKYVVLMAHYDGQGIKMVDGAEQVLPGARDNALGVATLLAAARDLAVKPGDRSVLILATTAEEPGMIGSQWFVDHSPINLKDIVMVLNTDGAGVYDPGLWCIGGLERTNAEEIISHISRVYGLL